LQSKTHKLLLWYVDITNYDAALGLRKRCSGVITSTEFLWSSSQHSLPHWLSTLVSAAWL